MQRSRMECRVKNEVRMRVGAHMYKYIYLELMKRVEKGDGRRETIMTVCRKICIPFAHCEPHSHNHTARF